jgi:hypothetical protein
MLLLWGTAFKPLHVLADILSMLAAFKLALLQVTVLISLPNTCLGQEITQQVMYCRSTSLT